MSFVRTLATLAAGFAVAKGVDKYKKMGGMTGVQESLKDNPALTGMTDQIGGMMEKMGIPGGATGLKDMMDRFGGATQQASDSAAAGLGGLMAALGGAAATGTQQAGEMMNAMTGNSAATVSMEENAKLMIRAMIQAAKADGEIDADEQARILSYLGDMSPDERAFVEEQMAAPLDVHALAADTSSQMKAQVYATAASAVKVDTSAEAQYLEGLAAALGLSPEDRAKIHQAMGLPGGRA